MSDSYDNRRRRLYAVIGTVVFHAALLLLLMSIYMRYDAHPEERQWPPVDSAEILFGGEYVMLGDNPELIATDNTLSSSTHEDSEPEQPQAEDFVNSGEVADPAPVLTSERPSVAKVEKKEPPVKTGPTKEEIEAEQRAKREREISRTTSERLKGAFGNTSRNDGNGNGSAGQSDGNSNSGATKGAPGANLGGRTLASWQAPTGNAVGTIVIAVDVDRQGRVTRATFSNGKGPVSANSAARNSCVEAARKSRFSVATDGPLTQRGTITYTFK